MVIRERGTIGLALTLVVGGVGGAAIAGCASTAMTQTPAEQASAWERNACAPFHDDSTIADVLNGRAIERVEPLYTGVQSKSSSPRLEGAVLTVRPIRGATAEWLDRSLECHGVERMLGRSVASGTMVDAFVLPGGLIRINVRSAGDGFRVELVGSNIAEAHEILSRADTLVQRPSGQVMATDLSAQ